MSAPIPCFPCSPTVQSTNIPGDIGPAAYTTVTAEFVVPALGGQIQISVGDSDTFGEGQSLFISDYGYFEVVSIPSDQLLLLEYLNITANTSAGSTVPVGAKVSPGSVGADGADGANSYTLTTANVIIPAVSATVTIGVQSNEWMVVGETVFIGDGTDQGHFTVTSKAVDGLSIVGTFLGLSGDSAPAATIDSGAGVTPSGPAATIDDPLLIANGGTSAATKSAAQVNLGLGQDITETSDSDGALAYDITNSQASVGVSVTVVDTGLYLILAHITVLYTGVTFAASQTLTMRVRNTTSNTTHSEKAVATNIHTTLSFPAIDYVLPIKTATLTAADVLELQCALSVVESAGSSVVTDASLAIIPLAL